MGDCCVFICQKEDKGDELDCKITPSSDEDVDKKKTFVNKLIDVALLLANVSQLNTLLDAGPSLKRYYFLLTLIITSIALQLVFAVVELILIKMGNQCESCKPMQASNIEDSKSEDTNNNGGNDNNSGNAQTNNGNNQQINNGNYQQTNNGNNQQTNNGNNQGNNTVQNKTQRKRKCGACSRAEENLEFTSIVLVIFIITANVFITGLGFSSKTS